VILGDHIISGYEDCHPFIASDESYLIFDSDDRANENNCWLFISFRSEDGTWTNPVNMGSKIPIEKAALARVTPDGKYLFFKSNGDIYWIDAGIIDAFRQTIE